MWRHVDAMKSSPKTGTEIEMDRQVKSLKAAADRLLADPAMENPAVCRIRITKPFALGAIIDPGHCLDLMESSSVHLMKMAHLSLEAQYDAQG